MSENKPNIMDEIDKMANIYAPAMIVLVTIREKAADLREKLQKNGLSKTEKIKLGLELYSCAIKENKKEVVEMLAADCGVPVDEYYENIPTMAARFGKIITEFQNVNFTQNAAPESTAKSSGSLTESTEGGET